jgi:hypothetical protein
VISMLRFLAASKKAKKKKKKKKVCRCIGEVTQGQSQKYSYCMISMREKMYMKAFSPTHKFCGMEMKGVHYIPIEKIHLDIINSSSLHPQI